MILQEYNFPNFDEIQKLEKKSYKDGSGIKKEDIFGFWKFQYVYKKGATIIDSASSSILQILYASLELSKSNNKNESHHFDMRNSIKFGILSIVFSGKAYLQGTRPILFFYFEKLSIKIFNIKLFNFLLKETDPKKLPFFSLIALGEKKQWMCARGKGGGLAIWIKGKIY